MSSILNKDYVNITYKTKNEDYTSQLCKYIIKTYNLKKGNKILDIGCGDGEVTKGFNNLGLESYGLDISEAARDNIGDKLSISNLDIKPYPFKDESFDIIFSKSVVEHLRDPDILIDESYRLLKPNGIFICLTPSWKHLSKEAFYMDHTHVTPFTRYSLEVACELSGFKSQCKYFHQLPLLWKYPLLHIGRRFLNLLNLPYRPLNKIRWSNKINKIIRFSKETMLICESYKK